MTKITARWDNSENIVLEPEPSSTSTIANDSDEITMSVNESAKCVKEISVLRDRNKTPPEGSE